MIIGKAVIPGRQAPPAPPIPDNVNDATWEQISEVSIAGTGDTYWDIGDCKAITLNGTIGTLSLTNVTLYVFILDFNHPINKSTADNNIIWGGFKTALTGGVDVALVDSSYGQTKSDGTKSFNINHRGIYNSGGWKGCDFRYDVLGGVSDQPSSNYNSTSDVRTGYNATQSSINTPVTGTLMDALPSDLRNALRLWNRYIDCMAGWDMSDSNCSDATIDAISMLAEFEIFGSRQYANQYEQNHQTQMAYYSAGNSTKKYRHNATGTSCKWWGASPSNQGTTNSATGGTYRGDFCIVMGGGSKSTNNMGYSLGIAPAFRT